MKLSRRAFWRAMGAMVLAAGALVEPCLADGLPAFDPVEFEDQLKVGLKPRLPEEHAFLKHVVTLVQSNQISLQLVMETFNWARKKKRYQMVYFEAALRKRAAEAGIDL